MSRRRRNPGPAALAAHWAEVERGGTPPSKSTQIRQRTALAWRMFGVRLKLGGHRPPPVGFDRAPAQEPRP